MIAFGSVCSGIEAASVAWHPLGWRAAWLAEIEPFPAAVLAHHYPSVPNLGDMTKLPKLVLTGKVAAPDVLVGGTPCQAFSVAGMREGLNDPRGQLTIKFVELADAIDHVRAARGDDPAIIAWENVPGVLSDRGNAFGCFLGALSGEDCELQPAGGKWSNAGCVFGPKRAVAWRVLDAQYFGVAQRRRRVFVVASARAGFNPAQVLFEFDGLRRDSAPSRGARTAVAALTANGVGTRGADDNQGQAVAVSLRGRDGGATAELGDDVGNCLRASGGGGDKAHVLAPVCVTGEITHTLKAEGFDGSEDGAGRGQPIVAFAQNTRNEVRLVNGDGSIVGALAAQPGMKQTSYVQHDMAVRRLTPRECERLQGFPDIVKTCIITVNSDSNSSICYLDQPSTFVLAAHQSHKSPNNALHVEECASPSIVRCAKASLNAGQAKSSAPVLVSARIDLERQHLQILSQGRLLLSVSVAERREWCPLPMLGGDFVRLIAKLLTWLETATQAGKEESLLSTTHSTAPKNGRLSVGVSGQEIEEFASDAEKFTSVLSECLRFTTSGAGQNSPNFAQNLQTLCCCVAAAMSSCIPNETRRGSSYALSIETTAGYTFIPYRNKTAADGPRYKAIGNSMAVPVMRWIGERIKMALEWRAAA